MVNRVMSYVDINDDSTLNESISSIISIENDLLTMNLGENTKICLLANLAIFRYSLQYWKSVEDQQQI